MEETSSDMVGDGSVPPHVQLFDQIKQSDHTIFRLDPNEWNNVPRILYEAIGTIVNTYD
jgi:hypothetical protein